MLLQEHALARDSGQTVLYLPLLLKNYKFTLMSFVGP